MRIEDYKIRIRTGRAAPTGAYEITRIGTRRAVTRYCETYQTTAGEFTPEAWREAIKKAIQDNGEWELCEKIKEYCQKECAWLKKLQDLEDYSMDCLAGRIYLKWPEFCFEKKEREEKEGCSGVA